MQNENDHRLKLQSILRYREECDGDGSTTGYEIDLACGHTVWTAIEPVLPQRTHCGECLNAFVAEVRESQRK